VEEPGSEPSATDEPDDPSEPQITRYGVSTRLTEAEAELQKFLVSFSPLDEADEEEERLAKDIVLLDHRSLRLLGPGTEQRAEVRGLIANAVYFYHARAVEASRSLLDTAEAIFLQHMQAKNRLRYLAGVVLGCVLMIFFVGMLELIPGFTNQVIPTSQLPAVLLFASMGTVTSVLLRLSSIDLRDQTNVPLVVLSGATRPITAVIFSLVLYLLVTLKVVVIHVGTQGDDTQRSFVILVAFLCGFSERFASDVLSRFGGALGPVASRE
jgi:hypothetical protein